MNVSVCIPTYNQSQYLVQAVRSALNQTVVPAEIIVSDDCSTDDTAAVLEELVQEIPILKVIRKAKNLGISQNTDECLRQATGDFVVRLDSDDLLGPSYLEKLSALLVNYPEAAYAHAAIQEIDQRGNFLKQRVLARQSGFQASNEALLAAKKGYRVAANIVMFRRSALEAVNYSTGRPNYVEDFHLSASLAAAGYGNVYLNEVIAFYRVWTDAGKARQRRKLLEINGLHRVFEEVLAPAYAERKWDLAQLGKQRTVFACTQADCLGWDVYTAQEVAELTEALQQLSPSRQVKLFTWIYSKGFGFIPNAYAKSILILKSLVKNAIISKGRESKSLAVVSENS